MLKNSEKFGLSLLLAFCLATITLPEAMANNTLNQVDISKNSSNGLDFTLYTSSPYADNVVVTKKSDNKYVILMPNVNGTSGAKPDLSSVRDIVTDVDVRAINDGGSGYTKLTITTNGPVDIKTNTAKSSPITPEQREYRALIAQQKTNTTQQPQPTTTQAPKASTSFKLPEIQPTNTPSDIATAKTLTPLALKPLEQQPTNIKPVVLPQPAKAEKPAVAKVSKNTEPQKVQRKVETKTKVKEVSAKKVEQPKAQAPQPKPVAQPAPKPVETITPQAIPATETTATAQAKQDVLHELLQEKSTISGMDFLSIFATIKSKLEGRIPDDMPLTIALIIVPILCVIALFNLIRSSLQNSQMLKRSFFDNLTKSKQQQPVANYDNIINNENLSWQEKYQQYVDATGQTQQKSENNAQYTVFAQQQRVEDADEDSDADAQDENIVEELETSETVSKPNIFKSNVRPAMSRFMTFTEDEIQQNAQKFEKLLKESPSLAKTDIEEDIEEMESQNFTQEVVDEGTSIHNEVVKSTRLKAFAQKPVLEETHRNKKIKHRRVQIELPNPQEIPHKNLGYSQLHTNPRSFKDANLSVSDLITKSGKFLNIAPETKAPQTEYETISVDEYLNMMSEDNSKSKVTSSLSDVVANSFANIKPKQVALPKVPQGISNPIEAHRKETKEDYLSGLIVKSGYNIDTERGFYLVSLEGKSAIVGRINQEVFVLKKFDRSINKPLQVRMDNPNVYMVKADNYKSLIEVQKDNMGVLIEL